MVYIYKKNVGSRSYYYLRASERKRDKIIVKDIAYLGSSLEEVKKSLDKLPRYKDEIRKAYKTINNFLESNRYIEKIKSLKLKRDIFLGDKLTEIEACKLHYNTSFKRHQEITKQEILKNFIIEFAFNTTSIEGNTIKLNEARRLLEQGLTPKGKTIREIYDVQNTEKVFLRMLKSNDELGHNLIINIHSELMKNIDNRIGYRTTDVRVVQANFKATPAPYVKADMGVLLSWYEKYENKLHPLVLASAFHHKFEKIHPFMDGNGRAGRMILNYILIKNKYPPLIVHTKQRSEYLNALRTADKSNLTEINIGNYDDLINFVSNEMIQTYWNIFL